ncbi:MAG TPA: energy transducer TonB, partial [Candidatus Acidoferrales bacterium]|nr:energy transducer TonB [Candidatus Acidoferrales bacterium]
SNRLSCLSVILLSFAGALPAQDLKLRQEATTMLEHAAALSAPSSRIGNRVSISFRAAKPDGTEDVGTFNVAFATWRTYRTETLSTDFHTLTVNDHGRKVTLQSRDVAPAVEQLVWWLVPIHVGRFDHADVIRSIVETGSNGRPARCIEFDTTYGAKTSANEICIDKEQGTEVHMRLGAQTYNYSAFFPWRGALLPAHLEYEENGTRIAIEQSYKELEGALDPSELVPPPGGKTMIACQEYRQPFGVYMPQPKAGASSQITDIVIRGEIRTDGKMYEPTIDSSSRPDLNDEALALIRTWTFTPPTCDGEPGYGPAVVTLHFQGR